MTSFYSTLHLTPPLPYNVTSDNDNKCVFNEEFKFLLLPLSYSGVFMVGLPLNITAMWIFITKMRPWSPTTIYMFNLALSDTLYVLSLPTLVYYYADRNNWPFGEALCKTVRFLFYANMYSSILFLTCISAHRYRGVCHPIRSLQRMNAKHARIICSLAWLSVSFCLVPNLIFVTINPSGNQTICYDTTRPEDFDKYVQYSTAVMCLLFGIPCLIIMCCYGLMARKLKKPLVNGQQETLPSYKKRSIKTIVVVLIVFSICFMPFHITRTMYYYARLLEADCYLLNVFNFTYKITRPLASANSCMDPILYVLASSSYRKRLLKTVRRCSPARRRHMIARHPQPVYHITAGNVAVMPTEEIQNNVSLDSLGNQEGDVKGEEHVVQRSRRKQTKELTQRNKVNGSMLMKDDGVKNNMKENRYEVNTLPSKDTLDSVGYKKERKDGSKSRERQIAGACPSDGKQEWSSKREAEEELENTQIEISLVDGISTWSLLET